MATLYLLLFVFGLVLGSFVNALEYRITNEMGMGGRSMCPHCKHQLDWYDLVPVFSWLILKGRCRHCKKQISVQYPIVEILSGLSLVILTHLFVVTQLALNGLNSLASIVSISLAQGIYLVGAFLVVSLLTVILTLVGLHDYKTGYVLSLYVYVGIAVTLLLISFDIGGFLGFSSFLPHLYTAFATASPFALIWLISRGKWMGAGDIELAFLVGLVLGWPGALIGLYFSFIVGSLVGLALVSAKKSKLKSEISFGPFLVAGIYFSLCFSQQIADFYVRMFL